MTFNGLATASLLEIGAVAQGEVPTSAEVSDLQLRANAMIDAWTAERLMIFTVPRTVYTLTANQAAYTLGPGGGAFNLSAVRPSFIERLSVIQASNPLQPLELPIPLLTIKEWQRVPVKNITSTLSMACWDDQGFPQRTLTFWPTPSAQIQIALYPWTALSQFADLTTDHTFPPGYQECLIYNLAVRAAPSYMPPGTMPNPVTVQMARESVGKVKRANAPLNYADIDPSILDPRREVFNYYTGDSYIPGGSPW